MYMHHIKVQGDPYRETIRLWYILLKQNDVPKDIIKIMITDLNKDYLYKRENEARKYMRETVCSNLSKFVFIDHDEKLEHSEQLIKFVKHNIERKFLKELKSEINDIL